jgi:hypothetical protein
MPYKLGDRTLALDVPWEHNDIQYPANWLRLSTAQDRAELGIVWEAEGSSWNQKFYWGYDADANLLPKTYADLKTQWIAKTKETANSLLQPSDWMVVRAAEGGTAVPDAWTTWRSTIRTECGTMVTAIEATADVGDTAPHSDFGRVEALQQYIEGDTYGVWTADPDNAAE